MGVVYSSVAEYWQLKPEALGSTIGGSTFLPCPLPFQRSTDSNEPRFVSLIRHNHDQSSDHRGVLSIGLLPAVICSKITHTINFKVWIQMCVKLDKLESVILIFFFKTGLIYKRY